MLDQLLEVRCDVCAKAKAEIDPCDCDMERGEVSLDFLTANEGWYILDQSNFRQLHVCPDCLSKMIRERFDLVPDKITTKAARRPRK